MNLLETSAHQPVRWIGGLACTAVWLVTSFGIQPVAHADISAFWKLATQAVGHIAHGEFTEAVIAVGQAREHRTAPELDALVGLAALAGGRPTDAFKLLKASAAHAGDPRLYYWAARAAYANGQPQEVRQQLRRALAVGGDQPVLQMGQALMLQPSDRQGALIALVDVAYRWANLADPRLYPIPAEAAVDLLETLLRDMPDQSAVLRTQGYLYWHLGRVLQAQERFFRLVARREGDADALHMLAQCAYRLGQLKDALELAEQALRSAPERDTVQATYGELLWAAGRAVEAIPLLRRAVDARPSDGRLLVILGRACMDAHDLRCANEFFGYGSRRDVSAISAHIGLALARQQLGDVEGTERALQRAYALDPLDPHAYEIGAHAARLRRDVTLMRRRLAQARRRRPTFERFEQTSQRAKAVALALTQAVAHCGCRPRCTSNRPACLTSIARLPRPMRMFIRAHRQLQRRGRSSLSARAAVRATLQPVLRVLAPRRLLGSDPCIVAHHARVGRKRYVLPELFPFVLLFNPYDA